MLWQIRGGFWESLWVFIHKWLRLAHKHWKRAWHSGTCARGASWYVSINVVQVSQLLHGRTALMFKNYTNASFALGIFISMARMKQRAAHYSRLHGAGMARFHIINIADLSCFRQKCSESNASFLFSCGLVWVVVIIIIHYTFLVKFKVK